MKLTYTSLLAIQRDLYRIPRGMERFGHYLRVMINPAGDDVRFPPLVLLNPMAKDHLATIIDQLLDIDADAIVAAALHEARAQAQGR